MEFGQEMPVSPNETPAQAQIAKKDQRKGKDNKDKNGDIQMKDNEDSDEDDSS